MVRAPSPDRQGLVIGRVPSVGRHQIRAAVPRGRTRRPQIRINLLDGFQLWRGRAAVATPLSVQKVLAFMALQRRTLNRGYVAGVLWSATTEEHAGANLRSALWRARRSGLQLIETTRTDLRLVPSVAVDVREMLAAVERMTEPTRHSDPPEADLSQLTGDLLPGWYDDWVVMERERLRQIRLHALEAMSRRLIAAQAFDRAILAGLAAVTSEPLRESANRILIEAYLAEGNVADAILLYRRYRSLLLEELGVRPTFSLPELTDKVPISMT